MKTKVMKTLLSLAVAGTVMVINTNTVYATMTQDEAIKIWTQMAEEEGINIDDWKTGGANYGNGTPASGYEYGGEKNPNQNPAPLAGESNNANTQQPAATEKPADTKPAHEHKYTADLTTDPTCTEEGVMTYTCECGDTYTEPYPALGHQYNSEITKRATCIEEGEETFTCTLCGDMYVKKISKTDHKNTKEVITVEPTCTEDGTKTLTCELCEEELSTEAIPAKEHTPGEQELIKKATLFSEGEAVTKCTICGEILETEAIQLDRNARNRYYAGIAIFSTAVIILVIVMTIRRKKSDGKQN